MTIDEATLTLDSVLALREAGQVVVSTGSLDARLDQWIRLRSLRAVPPAPATERRRGYEAPRDEGGGPRDETESRVARIWEEVLGVAPVGIHDGFAELGGHSLLAIRIVTELRRVFEVDLPVGVIFEAPTVAKLSRRIEERLVDEIDALSDDEARALVASP
jgi:acyl carrier protein